MQGKKGGEAQLSKGGRLGGFWVHRRPKGRKKDSAFVGADGENCLERARKKNFGGPSGGGGGVQFRRNGVQKRTVRKNPAEKEKPEINAEGGKDGRGEKAIGHTLRVGAYVERGGEDPGCVPGL